MWITNRKISKWIDIFIENPFKTWWKARKYFKIPNIEFQFFIKYNKHYSYYRHCYSGKLLNITICDLMWKDKYDSPRHEMNPYIYICLFNTIGFKITPYITYKDEFGEDQNGDMFYWEYILNYLYYNKSLLGYSTWTTNSKIYKKIKYGNAEDGSEDTFKPMNYIIPCVSMSLNRRGIKKFKQELKNDESRRNITDD